MAASDGGELSIERKHFFLHRVSKNKLLNRIGKPMRV